MGWWLESKLHGGWGDARRLPCHRRRTLATHDAEQRMLGALPGEPALGRGPAPSGDYSRHEYHHPAAGWGAALSVSHVLERAAEPLKGLRVLFVMNHENGGLHCPASPSPAHPHRPPPPLSQTPT